MSKKRKTVKADEIPILIITNERTPFKGQQMLMLYKAASLGQLGYMDGLNPETGEVDSLLVGIEYAEDGQVRVAPLAKFFSKYGSIPKYWNPDGIGNYIDNTLPDKEEGGQAEEGPASIDLCGDSLGGTPNTTIQ